MTVKVNFEFQVLWDFRRKHGMLGTPGMSKDI